MFLGSKPELEKQEQGPGPKAGIRLPSISKEAQRGITRADPQTFPLIFPMLHLPR